MYKENFSRLLRCTGNTLGALVLTITLSARAEEQPFEVKLNSDGIKVELRKISGSKYTEFRATTIADASLVSTLALLQDTGACTDWVFRCADSKLLAENGLTERYFIQVTQLPFPVKSRDLVLHAKVSYLADKSVVVTLVSVPDYIAENRKHVRIVDARISYHFEAINEQQTRITWQQFVDPAGSLPGWMVNTMQTDLPYKSLLAFKNLVKTAPYKNARFSLNESGELKGIEM